ncbi:NRDE2-like protein [Mya arenaria]|uniref:NRDE2-like protein n=1 Tax=Mya arenaria TaxID=6604 RepID=A0ABY7FD17_MYAAR|nr:NRDE2-like protein [Mya arenaria]
MGGKIETDNKEDSIVELDETRVKSDGYNRKLRENQGDVKLWLDKSKKGSVNEKKMTEKAVLEKKISIIKRALGHYPGHINLLLAKIELSADSSKINKDLEHLLLQYEALEVPPHVKQSRLTVFTVAKQCKLYHKCLKMLLRIHTGVLHTHSVPENLEHEIIESKMAAFEEFWDNESAKLGTQGACGWNQTGREAGSVVLNALEEKEEDIIERKESKNSTWFKIELLRDHHHWLPWKPDLSKGQTEEDCEDPERLVVYDDVKPVVFDISEMLHYDLIIALLEILGHESQGCLKSKFLDAFVSLSDKLNAHDDHSNISGAVFELQSSCDLTQNPVLKPFVINILKQVILCFNGNENTSLTLMLLEVQLSCYKMNNLSKSDKKEIRTIVKNLYIEIERIIGKPGEAKAIAETALAIYSSKNIEETTPESIGLIDLYSLYCDILMDINHGRSCELLCKTTGASSDVKKSVLATFACLLDEKKFDPKATGAIPSSSVLKTVSKFSKELERANANFFRSPTQNNKNRLLSTVWCYANFTYCKSGLEFSIDMISDVIQNLNLLTDPGVTRGLHKYKLKLIVHHMAVSSGLVSYLRDHLDQALQAFPNYPIFLSLFVDIERKSKISGRLNRFFDRACRMAESHIPVAVGFNTEWTGSLCQVMARTCILVLCLSKNYSSRLSGLVHHARPQFNTEWTGSLCQVMAGTFIVVLCLSTDHSSTLSGLVHRARLQFNTEWTGSSCQIMAGTQSVYNQSGTLHPALEAVSHTREPGRGKGQTEGTFEYFSDKIKLRMVYESSSTGRKGPQEPKCGVSMVNFERVSQPLTSFPPATNRGALLFPALESSDLMDSSCSSRPSRKKRRQLRCRHNFVSRHACRS